MTFKIRIAAVALTMAGLVFVQAAESAFPLENFESPGRSWSFSPGAEFPGAKGSFAVVAGAAHDGKLGGRLNFDFSGGGNYVAAILQMPAGVPTNCNALQLWVKRPEGHGLVFRYTDSAGQTLQKPVECAAGRWVRVTIPFAGWTGHWGSANDGVARGQPKMLALLIDKGENTVGALDFDDLLLVKAETLVARVTWPAYRFEPSEEWLMRADGPAGSSSLSGKTWSLDFSQGARSLAISVPDRTLPGSVAKIRLKIKGAAKGHPVRLTLRTHFMNFHKTIGEFSGEGEQELVTDGPPGTGWTWSGGENDGKIHGPLRLAEIQIAANGRQDRCTLGLVSLSIDGECPPEKRCLLVAETREVNGRWQFIATARALSERPLNGEITWVFRNWDGRELGRGQQAVSIPALAVPVAISTPVPPPSPHNFIEAEFALNVPDQEIPLAQTAWVTPLTNKGDAALQPESLFGMGLYLYRYGGDARGLAQMERAAQFARDAGVKWSREEFQWNRIEPRQGEYNWKFYDDLLACAKRNGITVYAIVAYWTPWTKPYTKEGVDDYVRYVQALVKRYKNDIKQWEIWNEPNIFFWQGPKEMYAELLIRSYAAIKEIDPQAEVLGLSTAGIDYKFIDQMLALKTPFDILTIHPYRRVLNDAEFISDLKKASDKVLLPDGRRRPVWLTEMGWATFTPHNTLRQDFVATTLRAQAELIARSYLCAIVSGVEPRTFWYNFRNDGEDPVYFEHQMGIMHSDFRPKPAYLAYAMLASVLKDKILDGPVPAAAETMTYRFKPAKPGGGEVVAIWHPTRDAQVIIPCPAAKATLMNAVGETKPVAVVNGSVPIDLRKGAVMYLLTQ